MEYLVTLEGRFKKSEYVEADSLVAAEEEAIENLFYDLEEYELTRVEATVVEVN